MTATQARSVKEIEARLAPSRGKYFKGEWPTITEMFKISVDRVPHRPCFTVFEPGRRSYDYSQVWSLVQNAASLLVEMGVKPGDKVVLNGKNSIQWGVAYLAINYMGAVIVPIDNQLHIDRVCRLAAFADAVFMIADIDVINKVPEDNEWFKGLRGIMTLKGHIDNVPNIMEAQPSAIVESVCHDENALAAILFTSGTTGNEKGAMLTNRNIISDAYSTSASLPVNEEDVLYALLPLHHSYACTTVLLETVLFGAQCVFGHGIVISRMINDLKQGHITIFMGIPLLYNKLLSGIMKQVKAKGRFTYAVVKSAMAINGFFKQHFGKSPLRGFFNKKILSQIGLDHGNILICGAGPLSPEVFKQYQQFGLDFLQGYGLTETSPVLTLNPIDHFKIDSIGMALPYMDIIVAEPDSEGVGEIRVKGPNVTSGYYKDPENTAALFDKDGYLKTGDLAILDNEGYFILKGRAKNIIVTEGGKNVYPEEIEDAFQTYENVEQILIRGYQQKKDVPCEAIEAVIYPSSEYYKDKGMDAAAIQKDIEDTVTQVNRSLVGYKKIEKITILDKPMEMTTTKKIKRANVAR